MKKKLAVFLMVLGLVFGPSFYKQARRDGYVTNRVVQLFGSNMRGSCSGIHVDIGSSTYILSASHCLVLQKDGYILVKDDGMKKPIMRRVLAEDDKSDLILLEALPGRNGIDIADGISLGDRFYSYTHGRGFATHKSEGHYIQNEKISIPLFIIRDEYDQAKCDVSKPKYRIEELELFFGSFTVCSLYTDSFVSEMFVSPGSSGGAVVNKYGDLVAIVFAGGGGFSFLVTLSDIKDFVKDWE